MMQIYEVGEQITQLMMEYEAGHFNDDVFRDTLESLDFESAAEEFIACYKNLIAEADMLRAEEKRLKERRDKLEYKADRWKSYLLDKMQLLNLKKIGQLHQASLRQSERVEVEDNTLLPSKFLRIKQEPDKTAIKAAIKKGQLIPGARLVKSQNINIA